MTVATAQDATPTIEAPTEAPALVELVAVDPVTDNGETVLLSGNVILFLVGGFLSGTVVGGAGAVVLLRSIVTNVRDNDTVKLAIERLAVSLPSDTLGELRSFVLLLKDVGSLGDELTDGVLPKKAGGGNPPSVPVGVQ